MEVFTSELMRPDCALNVLNMLGEKEQNVMSIRGCLGQLDASLSLAISKYNISTVILADLL